MALGDHAQLGRLHVLGIRALHQQAAADALEVVGVDALAQRNFQQAHVLLGREYRARARGEARRDQHFDELLGHHLRGRFVQRHVEGDDAAEGRGRVGLEGLLVGFLRGAADGHAARVGVLDDDARRALGRVERFHALPRRIGIGDVVVRQLLALQLRVVGQRAVHGLQVAVEGGGLVRVLAVAHLLHLLEGQVQRLRILAAGAVRLVLSQAGQVVGDGAVVLRGVREHFLGQHEVGVVADRVAVGLHLGQHGGVVGRIDDHRHVAVVLGGRAQHGRAADVDVLDGIGQRAFILGDGLLERIQVHHQQVDGRDAVLGQRRHVFGQVAAGQDAAVHLRVQGLDAAVEHFREAGVVGHFRHGQAGLGEQLGGAAGGEELDARAVQRTGKVDDAGLVGNGKQSLLDHGGNAVRRMGRGEAPSGKENRDAAGHGAGPLQSSPCCCSFLRSVLRLMPR